MLVAVFWFFGCFFFKDYAIQLYDNSWYKASMGMKAKLLN